jgi:hypothetical protein
LRHENNTNNSNYKLQNLWQLKLTLELSTKIIWNKLLLVSGDSVFLLTGINGRPVEDS